MATPSRPNKRFRASESESPACISQIHDDLYFDDGNVVLTAHSLGTHGDIEEAKIVHHFRVHKSLLSQHSPVLKELFAQANHEKYDNVPLIRLDDDPDNLRSLLKLFYDPYFVPSGTMSPDYASVMLGPVRLAAKYKILRIREEVIARVRSDWPVDVEALDRGYVTLLETQSFLDPQQYIRLIRAGELQRDLAHELTIMYFDLLDHISTNVDPNYELDDPMDYKILLVAQRKIHQRYSLFKLTKFDCKSSHSDHLAVQTGFISYVHGTGVGMCVTWHLHHVVIESIRDGDYNVFGCKLCQKCATQVAKQLEKFRKKIFAELPKLFVFEFDHA